MEKLLETELLHAVLKADLVGVQKAIERGADVNSLNGNWDLFDVSIGLEIRDALLVARTNAVLANPTHDKWTLSFLMEEMCDLGRVDLLNKLIENGKLIENEISALLLVAVRAGQLAFVQRLIQAGADVNYFDGSTFLFDLDELETTTEIRDALLDARTNAVLADRGAYEKWLLSQVSALGRLDLVNKLIGKGVGVNVDKEWGCSPLHAAARAGHLAVVQRLIAAGADVDAEDCDGKAAWEECTPEIEDVLLACSD